MNQLNESLDILFRSVLPDDILERYFVIKIQKELLSENIDRKMFSLLALSRWAPQYTDDEVNMVFQWLTQNEDERSVFDLLRKFTRDTLVEKDGEPLCQYEYLLAKGLAENHFHLKGSSPHFSLSWISLMNQFTNRRETFQWLEKEDRLLTFYSRLFIVKI